MHLQLCMNEFWIIWPSVVLVKNWLQTWLRYTLSMYIVYIFFVSLDKDNLCLWKKYSNKIVPKVDFIRKLYSAYCKIFAQYSKIISEMHSIRNRFIFNLNWSIISLNLIFINICITKQKYNKTATTDIKIRALFI